VAARNGEYQDQPIVGLTSTRNAGILRDMSYSHEDIAADYASTARQAIHHITATEDNALQFAMIEASLAVYHQLRHIQETPMIPTSRQPDSPTYDQHYEHHQVAAAEE
jgi:hypothetical protein